MNWHTVNWNTVGDWAVYAMTAWSFVSMVVQGKRQGQWHRIWNWPFKIGVGSWLLGFLLLLIPHSGTAFTLGCVLFSVGIVSMIVFVLGFFLLAFSERNGTSEKAA